MNAKRVCVRLIKSHNLLEAWVMEPRGFTVISDPTENRTKVSSKHGHHLLP